MDLLRIRTENVAGKPPSGARMVRLIIYEVPLELVIYLP